MDNFSRSTKSKFRIFTLSLCLISMLSLSLWPHELMASGARQVTNVRIQKHSDGTATVTFMPTGSDDRIQVKDSDGRSIGQLPWTSQFVVRVRQEALREATTPAGINILKVIESIGTMDTPSGRLVAAQLPYAVVNPQGQEIAPGSYVYFNLQELVRAGQMAPVAATAPDRKIEHDFQDRLRERGVVDVPLPPRRPPNLGVPRQTQRADRRQEHEHDHDHDHGHDHGPVPVTPRSVAPAPAGQRFLTAPTCSCRGRACTTTSGFGRRRSFRARNGEMASRFHAGVDIAAGAGTPIVAAADGCISRMYTNSRVGYGLALSLDHGNGMETLYGHLSRFSDAQVRRGRCFRRGDVVGYMGSTGRSTGSHLHFEVRRHGRAVQPESYMLATGNREYSRSCEDLRVTNAQLTQGQRGTAVAVRDQTRPATSTR